MMGPVMAEGCAGGDVTITPIVEAAEVPQALDAVTVMLPLVAEATVVSELVVEEPVHPPGVVQV